MKGLDVVAPVQGLARPGCGHTGGRPVKSVHTYFQYGIGISSELPLPELQESDLEETDVSIRILDHRGAPVDGPTDGSVPESIVVEREEFGSLRALAGREIELSLLPSADLALVRDRIHDTMLPALLVQRGDLLLHGSAVAHGNRALLFLGSSGSGKSTIASLLSRRGCAVVTDDIVCVRNHADGLQLWPGASCLRLLPDSIRFHTLEAERLPRATGRSDKRLYDVPHCAPTAPLSIERIFILSNDAERSTGPLPRQEACVELLRNTYFRFSEAKDAQTHQLTMCTRLTMQAPVFGHTRKPRLHDLSIALDVLVDEVFA
jgi:hypothetical protein